MTAVAGKDSDRDELVEHLRSGLAHPLTQKALGTDDPETTLLAQANGIAMATHQAVRGYGAMTAHLLRQIVWMLAANAAIGLALLWRVWS